MRAVALACLLSSGCSWVLMEKPPESPVRGQPIHCTASRGWAVVDLAFAVSDVATAVWISELDDAVGTDTNKPIVVGLGIEALLHGLSALTGIDRADRCSTMRDEYEIQPAVVVPTAQPAVVVSRDLRKVVVGTRPLFCLETALDVGQCFLDEAACTTEAENVGSAGPACTQRKAASCFNATKTLDGTKITSCAVSISDCEARLKTYAENPDYTVTKCGIYRVESR